MLPIFLDEFLWMDGSHASIPSYQPGVIALDPFLFPRAETPHGPPTVAEHPDFERSWQIVPTALREGVNALPAPWEDMFGPLRRGAADDLVVVGQIGQSLDGRSATRTGDSYYINRSAGLAHLHRLRALVDAVVVGVGTALVDDPQLTVRRVAGPHPARVVLDPNGRLDANARLLACDGVRRLVVTAQGARCGLPGVDVVALPAANGHIAPMEIISSLAALGFRRILIEGGADTLSRFLGAGCLDRLHVVVSPILLGAGRPSITLDRIDWMDQAMRPPTRVHWLDGEILFDCDLAAQRVPIGQAKKSMCPTRIDERPPVT
jgi:diaminohydroxyphosphoribosylaminopyrimidine deaminase / 5-amino-6-(5-phosphoribosylamino)uracil reductase